jgi:hypothetical protein
VPDQRLTVLVATAAMLLAAGCGGGNEDTPGEKAAKASPTAPAKRRATSRSGERHECAHASATGPYFATKTSNERHLSGQPSGRADRL